MSSALENLAGSGKPLSIEPPDAADIAGLPRSDCARLADARNEIRSLESRFDLACTAAHALCLIALRLRGDRARHRDIVFQGLPHTLGLGPERLTTCATWPITRVTWTSSNGWWRI